MTGPRQRPEATDSQRRFSGGGDADLRIEARAAARVRRARQQGRKSLRLDVEAALRRREQEIVEASRPAMAAICQQCGSRFTLPDDIADVSRPRCPDCGAYPGHGA